MRESVCYYCGEEYLSKYYSDVNYAMACSLSGFRRDDFDNDDNNVCYRCMDFVGDRNDGTPPFTCIICDREFDTMEKFVCHIIKNEDNCDDCKEE